MDKETKFNEIKAKFMQLNEIEKNLEKFYADDSTNKFLIADYESTRDEVKSYLMSVIIFD